MKFNKTIKKILFIFLIIFFSVFFHQAIASRALRASYSTLKLSFLISIFFFVFLLLLLILSFLKLTFYICLTKHWNRTYKLKNLLNFYFGRKDFNNTRIKKYRTFFLGFSIVTIFCFIGVLVFMFLVNLVNQNKNIKLPFHIDAIIIIIILIFLCRDYFYDKLKEIKKGDKK